MSYEYKDEIIMNLKDYNAGRRVVIGGTNAFESKIEELQEVYSQVSEYEQHKVATTILVNTLKSKANEYEAKAKAYDSLKNKLEKEVETLTGEVSGFPYVDAPIENTISHFEHVLEIMKNYESSELE